MKDQSIFLRVRKNLAILMIVVGIVVVASGSVISVYGLLLMIAGGIRGGFEWKAARKNHEPTTVPAIAWVLGMLALLMVITAVIIGASFHRDQMRGKIVPENTLSR